MWRASSIALALFAISIGQSLAATREAAKDPTPVTTTPAADANLDKSTGMMDGKKDDMAVSSSGDSTSDESADSDMIRMMEIQNECNDTFRIQNGYLEALFYNGSFPDESDRTPKCFVRCMLEKLGVVSVDGVFDLMQATSTFTSEEEGSGMKDVVAKCAAERNETCKCEKSYQFYKCLVRTEAAKNATQANS